MCALSQPFWVPRCATTPFSLFSRCKLENSRWSWFFYLGFCFPCTVCRMGTNSRPPLPCVPSLPCVHVRNVYPPTFTVRAWSNVNPRASTMSAFSERLPFRFRVHAPRVLFVCLFFLGTLAPGGYSGALLSTVVAVPAFFWEFVNASCPY